MEEFQGHLPVCEEDGIGGVQLDGLAVLLDGVGVFLVLEKRVRLRLQFIRPRHVGLRRRCGGGGGSLSRRFSRRRRRRALVTGHPDDTRARLPCRYVRFRAPNGPAKLKDCGPGLLAMKDL